MFKNKFDVNRTIIILFSLILCFIVLWGGKVIVEDYMWKYQLVQEVEQGNFTLNLRTGGMEYSYSVLINSDGKCKASIFKGDIGSYEREFFYDEDVLLKGVIEIIDYGIYDIEVPEDGGYNPDYQKSMTLIVGDEEFHLPDYKEYKSEYDHIFDVFQDIYLMGWDL